ncbi:hypothetical protein STEG23_016062, partial [Scotinomys teguina]
AAGPGGTRKSSQLQMHTQLPKSVLHHHRTLETGIITGVMLTIKHIIIRGK